MIIAIERLSLQELKVFLREQADDAFPDLKDNERLNILAEKWHTYAEFCTCRNDNGHLLGMIAFYANQPEEGVVYLPHVYVRSDCRGQKIMTSMFQIIEKYAKEKDFESFRLEVSKNNEIAQKAYFHYGFSYSGEASAKSIYLQFNFSKYDGK